MNLAHSAIWKRLILAKRNLLGYPNLNFSNQFDSDLLLFRKLIERAHSNGIPLTLVLIGGKSYVEDPNSFSGQYMEFTRQKIHALELPREVKLIDAALPMQKQYSNDPSIPLFFPNEGHFNEEGHRWISQFLLESGI
jgi:hypothetical protein